MCNYLKLKLMSTTNLSSVASNNLSIHQNILKADSGATKHFLKQVHAYLLRNLIPLQNGPKALLPNKTVITPSHSGNLPFSKSLSDKATQALIYPGITNSSLLSIGQLCDDDCVAIFTKFYYRYTKTMS